MTDILFKTRILALIKAIKKSIVPLLVLTILIGAKGVNVYNYLSGPKQINEFDDRITTLYTDSWFNNLKKQYIKYDITYLYEPFLAYSMTYSQAGGKTKVEGTGIYYYLIPVKKDYYVAVEVFEAKKQAYDKLYRQTYDYLGNKTDIKPTPITFIGGLYETSSNFRADAAQRLRSYGFDVDKNGLNAYLSPYILKSEYDSSCFVFFIVAAAVFVRLIFIWRQFIFSNNVQEVKNYLDHLSYEECCKLEEDYNNCVKLKGISLGEQWCFSHSKDEMVIVAYKDMTWMYSNIQRDRINGNSMFKLSGISIHDINSNRIYTLCKGVAKVSIDAIMLKLHKKQPDMLIGYSEENFRLYKSQAKR